MRSLDAYYVVREDDGWWIRHMRGRGRKQRYGPYSRRSDAGHVVVELNAILRQAEYELAQRLGLTV